jgi:L-serine deaminase
LREPVGAVGEVGVAIGEGVALLVEIEEWMDERLVK